MTIKTPILFEVQDRNGDAPNGHLMPDAEAAWRKSIIPQIEALIPDLAKGDSLDIRICNDPRRGLIIAKFGRAWTPKK